ncbi:MAG: hypothetical protein H6Q29_1541, partial [Bacteroidetes bacterium]|nr:hypothetical protein [Bacteroidota bacterium]
GRQHREIPMPFVVQRPGYIISPYFDYLSFLFDRRWRRPADGILALMIKLADSGHGRVPARGRSLDKTLTAVDRARLAEAEALTAADAGTLHPERLPANLYVADATLLPRSLGNLPILTILALARRVARAAKQAMAAQDGSEQQRRSA